MSLIKPWVKTELDFVLQFNESDQAPSRRTNRQTKKQHVQCVEVDAKRAALKINDSKTMVWCFVSRSAMKTFNNGTNPSFASLENKIITIEDWEFSTLSILCPTFDERRAKGNGQICLLICKFVLFSGERTTTIGRPTNLAEGNRDLRSIMRTLPSPRDLVRVLAQGQGLTDLRDIDEVMMSAPDPQTAGLSWSDVDPQLAVTPAAGWHERRTTETPGAAEQQRYAGNTTEGTRGEERSSQVMSQNTLGMEYEGELEEGEGDYRTQPPSAGNVFSQEPMEMRPASPTPSPQLPRSVVNPQAQEADVSNKIRPYPPLAKPPAGNGDDYDHAPLGEEGDGREVRQTRPQESSIETANQPPIRDDPKGLRGWQQRKRFGSNHEEDEAGAGENAEDNGEEQEESVVDDDGYVSAGFTQLEVLPQDPTPDQPQPVGLDNELEYEDDGEQVVSASSTAVGQKGNGKGKAKAQINTSSGGGDNEGPSISRVQPPAQGSETGRSVNKPPQAKGKQKRKIKTVEKGCRKTIRPAAPPRDIISPARELTEGTLSSSAVPFPSNNQLERSSLTLKRQSEAPRNPGSGERPALRRCHIRSRFGGSGAAAAESKPGEEGRRRGGSGGDGVKPCSTRDAGETEGDPHGERNPIFEKAAKMFPRRPLRCGSLERWERDRPLSDVLVAIDLKWDGEGRPPIVARGYDVDPFLAEWLDAPPREKRPTHASIAELIDSLGGRSKRKAPGARIGGSCGEKRD